MDITGCSVILLKVKIVNGEMLGYFTLASKPLTFRGETVNNTTKRKGLRDSLQNLRIKIVCQYENYESDPP